MSEPEIVYCDDYEAITGQERSTVQTKVVAAPETPEPEPQTVAETA